MKDAAVFGYLTVLLISGVVMGTVIGIAGSMLIPALKKTGKISGFK